MKTKILISLITLIFSISTFANSDSCFESYASACEIEGIIVTAERNGGYEHEDQFTDPENTTYDVGERGATGGAYAAGGNGVVLPAWLLAALVFSPADDIGLAIMAARILPLLKRLVDTRHFLHYANLISRNIMQMERYSGITSRSVLGKFVIERAANGFRVIFPGAKPFNLDSNAVHVLREILRLSGW